jgi:integrase
MARSTRSTTLETRTARLRLPIAKKPVFVKIGPGTGLGYRRNRTAGTWVARVSDGKRGNWTKAIGHADDFDEADGTNILDFWQAQERARTIGRTEHTGTGSAKPATVADALEAYDADLKIRGGHPSNVMRVRGHVPDRLLNRAVALLTAGELRRWRDGLLTSLKPATVKRTCAAFKAALNLAAEHDARIATRNAWQVGLAAIPDAEQTRNVILHDAVVREIIAAAYRQSTALGLLVEVAAVTGARVSQLANLEIQDFQDFQPDRAAPRLMMPTSRKGKGMKVIQRRPVPIPQNLAAKLRALTVDRPATAPLLLKPSGTYWRRADHSKPFARAAKVAGQDPKEVTMYALRHSSIVRAIKASVPIRIIAASHDTSVMMIERTYSRFIGDHTDALARAALLDTTEPDNGNIVTMYGSR